MRKPACSRRPVMLKLSPPRLNACTTTRNCASGLAAPDATRYSGNLICTRTRNVWWNCFMRRLCCDDVAHSILDGGVTPDLYLRAFSVDRLFARQADAAALPDGGNRASRQRDYRRLQRRERHSHETHQPAFAGLPA